MVRWTLLKAVRIGGDDRGHAADDTRISWWVEKAAQGIETLAVALILGILVLIRTFLSWSLMLEVEGRWPWQSRALGESPRAVAVGFETDAGTPLARRRG